MQVRTLGRSGLRVSELCLGTMTFGEAWGWGASEEASRRIFDAFVEAGGSFIDTANSYTDGQSEEIVGRLIASDREGFVLSTKYTHAGRRDDPNGAGNHRKNLIRSLEESLVRLDTDYIDVLWLHAWDAITPVDEVMRALDDLVSAGKVLYIGVSDTPAWVVSRANTLAELRGWSSFVGLQTEYSLVQREAERDLIPMAADLGIEVLAWGPLGAGLLTGKYTRAPADGAGGRLRESEMYQGMLHDRNLEVARAVDAVAGRIGAPPAAVAIAWLRHRAVPVIPIVGARDRAQLEESLAGLDVELTETEIAALDEVGAIELGFPHDFLRGGAVRQLVYAGTHDRLVI
ncbi:MAG: aldo/keto reductase [Gemmatimonadota bacterium]